MLSMNPEGRDSIYTFYSKLDTRLKIGELRHSGLRERILRMFHAQRHPVSVYTLVGLLKEEDEKRANYSSVVRHVKFFNEIGWLKVVKKSRREYLLVRSPQDTIGENG